MFSDLDVLDLATGIRDNRLYLQVGREVDDDIIQKLDVHRQIADPHLDSI